MMRKRLKLKLLKVLGVKQEYGRRVAIFGRVKWSTINCMVSAGGLLCTGMDSSQNGSVFGTMANCMAMGLYIIVRVPSKKVFMRNLRLSRT